MELRHGVTDDLTEHWAITPLATQGQQQQRDTGLVLHHSRQPHVVEVRAMILTRAVGNVHDLCVRKLRAGLAAIDMKPRCIEMVERARQPQTCGRCSGKEAIEGRDPKVVEGLEGAPEGVIIEMAGLHAWGNET